MRLFFRYLRSLKFIHLLDQNDLLGIHSVLQARIAMIVYGHDTTTLKTFL